MIKKRYIVQAMVVLLLAGSGTAVAEERSAGKAAVDGECLASIGAAHLPGRMPVQLVRAISTVEAGRPDPASGRVRPWPWTINVGGNGYFYQSKAQAMAAVLVLQAAGIRSIDVGCMQVNLMYHPHAFASLDDAFDPSANVAYAIGFLSSLFGQTRSWPDATAAYHSQTAQIGADYEKRVMALYPMQAAAPARPVEVAEAVDTGVMPEMLRLQRENQQDQDRLRALFGLAEPALPGSKPIPSARSVRRIATAATATGTRRKLLLIADRSWLNGASTN